LPRLRAPIATAPARGHRWRWGRQDVSLLLSGSGDVLEPEGGVIAIGSGGNYAWLRRAP